MIPNQKSFIQKILSAVVLLGVAAPALASYECKPYAAAGLQKVHVPKKNSIERKAILDALRKDVADRFSIDAIFVVNHFKANLQYAFLQVDPKSKDGHSSYEPLNALLKRESGCWQLAGYVSFDDPDESYELALNRLRDQFPDAPDEIF